MYPSWQDGPPVPPSHLPTLSTAATSDHSTQRSHGVVWVADRPAVAGGLSGRTHDAEHTADAWTMRSASFASQDGTLSHSRLLAGHGQGSDGTAQVDRNWQAEGQYNAGRMTSNTYPPTSASFDHPSYPPQSRAQYAPATSVPSYGDAFSSETTAHQPLWRQIPHLDVSAGRYPLAHARHAADYTTSMQPPLKRTRTDEGSAPDSHWHAQYAAMPTLEITTSLPTATVGLPQLSPSHLRSLSHSTGSLQRSLTPCGSGFSPLSSMSSAPSSASLSGPSKYDLSPSAKQPEAPSPSTFVLPLPRPDLATASSFPPSAASSASTPFPEATSSASRPPVHPAAVPSPPPAPAKAEKSCAPCRARKVRCSRTWPKCARCIERRLECGYGGLVPIEIVKQLHPESRVVELEARIKSLESELAHANSLAPVSPGSGFNGIALASDLPFEIYDHLFGHPPRSPGLTGPSTLYSFDEAEGTVVETPLCRAHVDAVCSAVRRRAVANKALAVPEDVDAADWRRTVAKDAEVVDDIAALGVLERCRHPDWIRWVLWALIDAFWATCSSNIPTFRPCHSPTRKLHFYLSLSSLTTCERVVLAAFLSIGIRSTDDVALLGISPDLDTADEGRQRENLTKRMRTLMYELYERAEIGFGEGSEAGLQAALIVGVVSMWNELLPRRTRSIVRTSLGVFKDLVDSTPTDEARQGLQMMYALPLLHQDSTVAAYLRSSPLISDQDLATYFSVFPIPLIGRAETNQPVLPEELGRWLDVDRLGGATHMQHMLGSMVLYRWLSACLRWCAEMSCAKSASRQLTAASVDYLLSTLSSLHAYIQTLQHYLTHAAPASAAHPSCLGPGGDTCKDVHLRWATRLDREIDDATWLAFSVVGERLFREEQRLAHAEMDEGPGRHTDEVRDDIDIETLKICETKVRKGLKLAAFYFNFFANSPDPHQTHHLAWSLELIPSWTFLATQRCASPSAFQVAPDPLTLREKATELTERELDWIERGLDLAQRYHPVAERRLNELRMYRAANQQRVGPQLVVVTASTPAGKTGRSFREAMAAAVKQTVPAWA